MNVEVLYRPGMSLARVNLGAGESIRAESGAMVGMSTHLTMETGMTGGMLKGLGRMLGGESFFQNTFTAQGKPGELLLAHALPGDIETMEVPEQGLFVQSTSYIAGDPAIEVKTEVGGFKTLLGGEGLFVLRATASGPGQHLIVGAFGGVHMLECDGSLTIDTGHLVCWETQLQYKRIKAANGFVASFLSGEGYVFRFEGKGRIWIQTRNPKEFGTSLASRLPPI